MTLSMRGFYDRAPAEVAHGPMMIGLFINSILFGIMVMQVMIYMSSRKSSENPFIRYFVGFLFIGDTAQTIFVFIYLYISLITHFGDTSYLGTANWIFQTDPALTGIIAGAVQLFYAWRIQIIARKWWLTSIITATAIVGTLGSLGVTIAIGIVPNFTEFQKFQSVVIIWLVSATLCDIVITISLVQHLRKYKGTVSSTDQLVDRIIRLTVQTCMTTSVFALADLLVFVIDPTGDHLVLNFILAKLYTNSLMSSLNAKKGWHTDDEVVPGEYSNSHSGGNNPFGIRNVQVNTVASQVHVKVERHEMHDIPMTKQSEIDVDNAQKGSHGKIGAWPYDQESQQ